VNEINRRKLIQGIAATGLTAAIAGCSDGGDETATTDGNESDDSDDPMTEETTDGSGGDTSSVTFDYTFGDSDDSVGSSLTGISVAFPDGSGAVSDASVASVTLGGSDVSGDIDGSSASNNDTTFTVDFGGSNSIRSGDELVLELSGVGEPSGSYEATATVNPQSGGTEFTESF